MLIGAPSLRADADSQAIDSAASSLEQTAEGLSDDDCLCQDCGEKLANGKWSGIFHLAYSISAPGAASAIKMHQLYQGTLDLLVKKRGEHYDESSLLSDEDHIRGTASAQMTFSMAGAVSGANLSGGANNQSEIIFEADGPPVDVGDFSYIKLKHEPGGLDLAANSTISSADLVVTGRGNISANGSANLDITGHTSSGSFEKSTTVNGVANSSGDGNHDKVTWFQLNIENKGCAIMSGKIDTTVLLQSLAGQGMTATVTEADWSATYIDRDVNFEKQVDELLAQPTPAHPTTNDVQELLNQVIELRRNSDEYHLCVLAPLLKKLIRMDLALIRHEVAFVNWLPVDSLSQVNQSLQEIMRDMRFLQLLGVEKCQIMEDLRKSVEKKFQQAVRAMLNRSHTNMELVSVEREVELGMVSLGDVTGAFENALTAAGLPGGR